MIAKIPVREHLGCISGGPFAMSFLTLEEEKEDVGKDVGQQATTWER